MDPKKEKSRKSENIDKNSNKIPSKRLGTDLPQNFNKMIKISPGKSLSAKQNSGLKQSKISNLFIKRSMEKPEHQVIEIVDSEDEASQRLQSKPLSGSPLRNESGKSHEKYEDDTYLREDTTEENPESPISPEEEKPLHLNLSENIRIQKSSNAPLQKLQAKKSNAVDSQESSLTDLQAKIQAFQQSSQKNLLARSSESSAKYEELAELLIHSVQECIKTDYGLEESWLPLGLEYESGPRCNIFHTKNWSSCKKALLLIQGAGNVRAGLWSRSVCINDSLDKGSMLPFLKFAQTHNYGLLIFNPNFCWTPYGHKPIPKNSTREAHGEYVWKHFIADKSSDLFIIAHSCGGLSVASLLNRFWPEFSKRVKAIAFTDAVHSEYGMEREKRDFLHRVARHWVASNEPGNKMLSNPMNGVMRLSAGHNQHEYTTGYAFDYIVNYLESISS